MGKVRSSMSSDRTTEILNYLSAISREVGLLRTEMNARFERLEARVGGLEGKVGGLEAEMRAGFEKLEDQMRRFEYKMDIMSEQWLEMRADLRAVERRTDALERKQA